ncbi:glycosyltransferase family 4 protein [Algoriphagus sp. NG3]|uniref:glycosyltransferase family 4 protein n=1 Tax=Algoriphagus sp. NG3 TaxID=3097546 RepID=UPI002A810DC9|nr:glycosyltransferase family 4 protein [Algoriphagus sp. NG3]WPR77513.1 glycosyltransferase family 4 protein [Algoriphagus sp. NG3]
MVKKFLVIGQTPPPYHGQSMMIKRLVDGEFSKIKIYHIRTVFSSSIEDIGKPSFFKIFHLLEIITKTYYYRLKHRPTVLVYYPITNSSSGILKDNIFLFLTRWLFKDIVFYFRSAGLIDFLETKSDLVRNVLTFSLMKPSLSILLTKSNPRDDLVLKSKQVEFIPNGIEDISLKFPDLKHTRIRLDVFNCLYIGLITKGKGIFDLIEAFRILTDQFSIYQVKLNVVGKFDSFETEQAALNLISSYQLDNNISFMGQQTGEDKWDQFRRADVLCFPTFYENESFGNVILEGFMCSLPVIGTDWRGISEIIDHNVNGLIVPIQSPMNLAQAILKVYQDEGARKTFARNARSKYETYYTLQKHLDQIEETLVNLH